MLQEQPEEKSDEKQKPICVVGMGPGGMVAAIETAKKGFNVVLIENRENYSRSQRVKLDFLPPDSSSLGYLSQLNMSDPKKTKEDDEFIERLYNEEGTVYLHLLQEFLERKIKNLYPDKIEIKKPAEVKTIDVTTNSLHVVSQDNAQTIEFSHIVGADGARHQMADKISEAAKASNGHFHIEYKDLELQTRQEPQGTVALRFKRTAENASLDKPPSVPQFPRLTYDDLPAFAKLGWDEPYLPNVYMFKDQEEHHFYIAGEIPNSILQEKDKTKQAQMLTEWGKLILERKYGFEDVDQHIELDVSGKEDKKSMELDKLKATAFPVTLKYAETPCKELPNKGTYYVAIGDASKNANFHLAHGAKDAIKDGRIFAACLQTDGSFDSDQYEKHQQDQRNAMKGFMQRENNIMKADYQFRIRELDAEISQQAPELAEMASQVIKQGNILIALAKLQPSNGPLQATLTKCEESYKKSPLDYDDVYTSTIQLADFLNQKAMQDSVAHTALLTQQKQDKMANLARKKGKRAASLFGYKTIVFNAVSSISSRAGAYINRRELKLQAEIEKLDASINKQHGNQKDLEVAPHMGETLQLMQTYKVHQARLKELTNPQSQTKANESAVEPKSNPTMPGSSSHH